MSQQWTYLYTCVSHTCLWKAILILQDANKDSSPGGISVLREKFAELLTFFSGFVSVNMGSPRWPNLLYCELTEWLSQRGEEGKNPMPQQDGLQKCD